jgi:hypothetical protein
LKQAESIIVFHRGWGIGNGESLFNGYGVLVLENENCSEMDGSDDCAAV